ncbi:GNAT family N-acetyltransferase [Shewanella sp. NFH-SH190041]|uniref:GNAT family N-acetyltransferase n=1 Tax=Shewanella sp. NFH-SH190041 TaxID=2950245 RepID=UPI0021C25E3D|nr:GNAT family N-acetyltransferase [Shewanella sp. NFH-SH190041]
MLKLRAEVFVVEQACVYQDLDDHDCAEDVFHLLGYIENNLVAYLRIIGPGRIYENVALGRVVIAPSQRNTGLGHQLLALGLIQSNRLFPQEHIEISAQHYLMGFYSQYGFSATSDVYLEDGIPHIHMYREFQDNEEALS